MNEEQKLSTIISDIYHASSKLISQRAAGTHAYNLHVDSDNLELIRDMLQDQVDAIQDEINNPQ